MLGKLLRAVTIVGILAAGLGIAAWPFFSRKAPPTRPAPSTALLVDTVPLQRVNAEFTVQSRGTVLPKTETELSSEVSGTIVDISPRFVAGGFFKAGEVLIGFFDTMRRFIDFLLGRQPAQRSEPETV